MAFTSVLYAEDSAVPMPNESLAIGVVADGGFGPFINYALNKDIHIGGQLGAFFDSEAEGLNWQIAVHMRAFLLRIQNMNVFASAKFSVLGYADSDDSPTNLGVNIGGMWYPFENLGLFAGINVFAFDLQESAIGIGLGSPFIGMEFYLD